MSLEDYKGRGVWIQPDLEKASLADLYELFDNVGNEILARTNGKKKLLAYILPP